MKENKESPHSSSTCIWEVDIHKRQEDFESMEKKSILNIFWKISINLEGKMTNFYPTSILI